MNAAVAYYFGQTALRLRGVHDAPRPVAIRRRRRRRRLPALRAAR
jgi:hypothetical protein